MNTSPDVTYLFYHHSEFALFAQDGFHAIQPLHVGEDFSWPDEDLTRVKAVCLVEEQPLSHSQGGKR